MQTATLRPDVRLVPDPVSTPEKFRSGHYHLELTPVWQYVIKKNRFPANVDRQEVFAELTVRLQHPEWQVRLHGSRVLAYVIPAVGPQLDALMSPTILPAVITNLAHFSPALRSSSMDAILVYVQHSADPEFVLKSMIVQGLDVSGAKSSLTVNVMECVPVVLQQIVKRNGERPIAIPTFVHLVTALSNKMVQATFQQAAVYCLDRVKEIVGRNKFDHYLETFHPIIKKDFEVLCEVYRISSSSGRDSSISSYDDEDDVEIPKTPRRVTFGGELIKIRSPDVSDEHHEIHKSTGIPIPIKPALSIPKHPKNENISIKLPLSRQTQFRSSGNYLHQKRVINQLRPNTLPPLRQPNFKQFTNSSVGSLLSTTFRRKLDDRISFNKGFFSPHAIICSRRTNDTFNRNYKNMKTDKTFKNFESSVRTTFSMTVVPEISRQEHNSRRMSDADDDPRHTLIRPMDNSHGGDNETKSSDGEYDDARRQTPVNRTSSSIPIEDGAIMGTRRVNHDDRLPQQQQVIDNHKQSTTQSENYSDVGLVKPTNVKLQCSTTSVTASGADTQSQNDKKPVAEVKPTKSVVQPSAPTVTSTTERRRSVGTNLKNKRSSEIGPNFTPFNEPQRALHLVSTQINSPEWEAAVTGLQNISRLAMFHGKELRPGSLQPFARNVAKHIKCLRSQVARAACTAAQKMFSYVPKSMEPDVEEIASALFPRTADTNKFLRVQSAEALNAMVDNVNPVKCVHVITAKGIKHGNRMVRAEACRLLARMVDRLGVSGTLHLPTDARDAVITAATNMVFDNTPTSRQAAQHILTRLSEDPRGAALISSAASPNVKATLNKSLSRIFLK
ncbi:uncharacterized protein LOC132921780 isoform X1 [Rhopalosiphum padi]|uniref:uncharacterized protein LOC132921780 isoform X1 n=1 Tax=Rhopalosiphum padi TaxID=40932 RepID=UPI00298EBE58|nr:uncharacterized protein LOC132921780 isoform X1 [Rhopalosiphum padi]